VLGGVGAKGSVEEGTVGPYVDDLLAKAKKSLSMSALSVTQKKRVPYGTSNKRYYFSNRPYHWHPDDLTALYKQKLKDGYLEIDDRHTIHVENEVNPAYEVGGPGDDLYDRASLFYTISNTTTLALAYYFTEDEKYAKKVCSRFLHWKDY
jgi:hypothetical protein